MGILDYFNDRVGFPGYIEFTFCPGYRAKYGLYFRHLAGILRISNCLAGIAIYQGNPGNES